jgi:hypothetical protein
VKKWMFYSGKVVLGIVICDEASAMLIKHDLGCEVEEIR